MSYWGDRIAKAQATAYNMTRKDIATRMRKHYQSLINGVLNDYEACYLKILKAQEEGKQPTTADLYRLDKYWQMQSELESKLSKLGKRQIATLTKGFRTQYYETYNAISIKGLKAFSTIDEDAIMQVINSIWCADGKSWSQRIWENMGLLKETLNEGLLHCVATGKSPSALKKILMERFNVSFGRTDALVRTELAHIQTQAAQKRYRDYGITELEVLADKDERQCEVCGKLHGKRYGINDKMPVPVHPRCRCCMIPVVNIPKSEDR